jgi:GR25 family glycosyltransferase involved in LPS biosynthesis
MLIRIMWCHEREDNINKMLSSLPKETEVIWDTDHNPCHTLQRVVDSDDSMLVMEDDIELCKNFLEKATAEIEQRPDNFIMFYSCKWWEISEWIRKEKGLPFDRPYVYTQAYYIPKWIGKKLSKFLETNERANNHRWSVGINEFLVQEWIDRYLVQPSLVQHIWKESLNEPDKPFERLMHQSVTYRYE